MSEPEEKNHWAARVPEPIWQPLTALGLILLVGAIAVVSGQVLLFPSLGPTAFLQTHSPKEPSSQIYHVIAGHIIGIVVAVAGLAAFGALNAPSELASHRVIPERVWASALAIGLLMLVSYLARAPHPPAAATTLLITLRAFKVNVPDLLTIVVGVLIIAAAGEVVRRLRLWGRLSPPRPQDRLRQRFPA